MSGRNIYCEPVPSLQSNLAPLPAPVLSIASQAPTTAEISFTTLGGITPNYYYFVFRSADGGANYTNLTPNGLGNEQQIYDDTGLDPAIAYKYRVNGCMDSFVHGAGYSINSNIATLDQPRTIASPDAPAISFSGETIGIDSITIGWSAISGAASYKVYRKAGAGAYALVGSPAGTSHTSTGLDGTVVYLFKVIAVGDHITKTGDSAASNILTAPALEAEPTYDWGNDYDHFLIQSDYSTGLFTLYRKAGENTCPTTSDFVADQKTGVDTLYDSSGPSGFQTYTVTRTNARGESVITGTSYISREY